MSCESVVPDDKMVVNETFKNLKPSLCDSIGFANFFCKFPKELTVSLGSKNGELISFSNKYTEVYTSIIELNSTINNSDSLFIEITDDYIQKFKQPLNGDVVIKEDYQSYVNDLPSRYYRVIGRSYGFPLKKSISLRFIQLKDQVILIHTWMIEENFEDFEWMEDVITSSLREIKKG